MCKKGVVRTLQDDLIGREWEQWVPKDSSNAGFTMRSVLSTLCSNFVWYVARKSDILTNFKSIC